MSGVRIYDLAKELNVSNHEVLEMLKEMGDTSRTPSSALPEDMAVTVRQRLGGQSRSRCDCRPRCDRQLQQPLPRRPPPQCPPAPMAAVRTARPPPSPPRRLPRSRARQVDVPDIITLKDFATLIGVPAPDIQKKLMGLGVLASLNQKLSPEVTTRLAKSYKVAITIVSGGKPKADGAAPERRAGAAQSRRCRAQAAPEGRRPGGASPGRHHHGPC